MVLCKFGSPIPRGEVIRVVILLQTKMAESQHKEFHGIRALSAVDALSLAASNSKLKEMRLLLEDGAAVNSIASYSKRTPLSAAASKGAAKAVELLLSNGADVNALDEDGSTPLMNACTFGKTKGYLVAQQLIAAGANVNVARSDERTALKAAIDGMNADLLQLLIDNGAEVDGPKGTNQTALMLAARNGDVKMLTVLIENGADRTLQCKLKWAENRTALGLAELEMRRNAVKYLKSLEEK